MADESKGLIGSITSTVRNTFSSNKSKEGVSDLSAFMSNSGSGVFDDFFGGDVFGEEEMNPHNEMFRVREMIDNNAFVASALSTYQSIFLGDELVIESSDDRTQEWFNEEWLPESGLIDAISNGGAGEHYKGVGNAYYHIKRGESTGLPKEVELIAKPENMWIRKNDDGSVRDYILEVDRGEQGDEVNDLDVQSFVVGYGGYEKRSVRGVRYEKDEIVHVAQGRGQIPPYGRSDLASASSDEKILREIERSYGVLARHKQVPKKIISLYKEMDGDRMPLSSEEFDEKLNHLDSLRDTDNPVWNNVEADIKDYSYAGGEIKMQETIDYLKRKVTAPLGPQALIHGDMTTQAVSNDQLAVFFQEVRGDRHTHIQAFKPILREIVEVANQKMGKGFTEDVQLKFGDLELDTEQGKRKQALDMWNKGVLTLNEVRDELDLPESDAFEEDPFKWEVQSQPAPDAVQQSLRQAIEGEEE